MAADEAGGRVVAARYELRSLPGRGGMGQAWLAHDTLLHRVGRIGLDLSRRWRRRTAGIVHRDVKPANALVSDQGRARPTDVGIASSTGEGRLTGHRVIIGSPSYIAPERARGDDEPGRVADVRVVVTQPYQLRVV